MIFLCDVRKQHAKVKKKRMEHGKEEKNLNTLLQFRGKSNIQHKKGRGTLTASFHGIFILGGDNGVNDDCPINKFLKFEFTADGSRIIELPKFSLERSCCTCAILGNYLYIIGGYNGQFSISDVQRFDFFSNTWETAAPLTYRKASLSSTVYKNKIYVIGGVQGPRASDEIECYDETINKWSIVGHLRYKRSGCGIGIFGHKIYVFGGIDVTNKIPLEIYDIEEKTIVVKKQIIVNLHSFGIHLVLEDNKPFFLIAGGGTENFPSKKSYLYNIQEEKLESLPPLHYRRQYIRLCTHDDKIFAIGGYDGNKVVSDSEFFDMKTRSWNLRKSSFSYCGYALFNQPIKAEIKGYWKENKLNGRAVIDKKWKGVYCDDKKNGLFTNLETNENVYFLDNFQVTKEKYDANKKIKKLKIPQDFLCPISYEIMMDPVITSNGSTYDRKNIVKWLSYKRSDPITGQEISSFLISNNILKKIIYDFLETKNIFTKSKR